ncbi:MAG: hypothetical protein RIF33_00235 [Cyclobacteriaceae bacterium]
MKQPFVLLCSIVSLITLIEYALSQKLILLPQPQSIKMSGGFYDLNSLDEVTISYPILFDERTNARIQLTELFAGRSLKWN